MISFKELTKITEPILLPIIKKIRSNKRINDDEALKLFNTAPVPLLGLLANEIREKYHSKKTYFNKNIHIEPTNICVFDCKFCAYSRKITKRSEGWEFTEDEMIQQIIDHEDQEITEVHIVGGVHPKMGLDYFTSLIKRVKNIK